MFSGLIAGVYPAWRICNAPPAIMAMAQGWYEQRATVQTIFVLTVAITGVVALSVLLKLTRDLLPRHVLAFVGLAILAMFVVVRAVSFHSLEGAMQFEIVGMRLSWYLEMAGILCVGTCAVRNYWWHTRKPVGAASLTGPGG